MSLNFSVASFFVRPFVAILGSACKLGEAVFFEPHETYLDVRVVHPSHSCHLLITIDAEQLEDYRYVAPSRTSDSGLSQSPSREGGEDFHLCVLAKALHATLLRQNSTAIQTIYISHTKASRDEENPPEEPSTKAAHNGCRPPTGRDEVRFECVLANGIVKTFDLHLVNSAPARAVTDLRQHHFHVCSDPKLLGGLLASFPGGASLCVLQPLDARVELRCMERPLPPGARRRGGSGLLEEQDARSSSSSAVISAYPPNFLVFRYFHFADEMLMAEAPAVTSLTKTRPDWVSYVPLPGKHMDLKPLKTAAWLAGQLGLYVDVLTGSDGVPVVLKSCTAEEAALVQREAARMKDATAAGMSISQQEQGRRDEGVVASSFASGRLSNVNTTVPSFLGLAATTGAALANCAPHLYAASEPLLGVSFTLHIAALDVPLRDGGVPLTNGTTLSSTAPTDSTRRRASVQGTGHDTETGRGLGRGTNAPPTGAVSEGGRSHLQREPGSSKKDSTWSPSEPPPFPGPGSAPTPERTGGGDAVQSQLHPSPYPAVITVSCTEVDSTANPPPSAGVVDGPWHSHPQPQPSHRERESHSGATSPEQPSSAGLSHVSASYATDGTPGETRTAGSQLPVPSTPMDEINSAYQMMVVGLTASSRRGSDCSSPPSTGDKRARETMSAGQSLSQGVAATPTLSREVVPATLPQTGFPVLNFTGLGVDGPLSLGGRPSVASLYPLDYEAFAHSADEVELDEEDEELQRFLNSCTTMMRDSMPPIG